MEIRLRLTVILLVLFSVFSLVPASAHAETAAAAASLQPFLEKAITAFNHDHGVDIKGVYGASGNLARQIEAGAPFDIFLSADEKWARYVEGKGLLDDEPLPFAAMPLVLWQGGNEEPSPALLQSGNMKVAIANPETAPFGRMAKEYLQAEGFLTKIEQDGRLILCGDVLKTALAASSGGADLAIIPLSIALRLGEGKWIKLDTPPQTLFGALVKGRKTALIEEFWKYLRSSDAESFMDEFGFLPVRP
ncbi:molybdate ABC transporter substrate-binding protein [Aminivibrio sp.]|uniref:molybdate ABC transporter substrate-binding protein n=1 Tax=Aminivibrio sp. TaxID=1872489 RepID=UPI003D95DA4F